MPVAFIGLAGNPGWVYFHRLALQVCGAA